MECVDGLATDVRNLLQTYEPRVGVLLPMDKADRVVTQLAEKLGLETV